MEHLANASTRSPDHRYLRVADLRALRHMIFASRRAVEGRYTGRHKSHQRGQSAEFVDYRQYIPGDEVGHVDWKVYARSDRLFIKLFEHQSDMTVNLLVDGSASMGYAGIDHPQTLRPAATGDSPAGDAVSRRSPKKDRDILTAPSKYDYACLMAAAIAFLVTNQQDRVSFGIAQEGLQWFHGPIGSTGQLPRILEEMETVNPDGHGQIAESIRSLARRTSRRGLLVLFSDLFEDREQILKAFSLLTHRGTEVVVFQVLHADELNLPQVSGAVFVDSESQQRVRIRVDDIRSPYEKRLKQFLDGWSASCRGQGIDHQVASTATPYQASLQRYLFGRDRAI